MRFKNNPTKSKEAQGARAERRSTEGVMALDRRAPRVSGRHKPHVAISGSVRLFHSNSQTEVAGTQGHRSV